VTVVIDTNTRLKMENLHKFIRAVLSIGTESCFEVG